MTVLLLRMDRIHPGHGIMGKEKVLVVSFLMQHA